MLSIFYIFRICQKIGHLVYIGVFIFNYKHGVWIFESIFIIFLKMCNITLD